MLVWHDETDSFECSGFIPGISVVNSLSKTFPASGKYAGGMMLRLYNGIGVGIAFTKSQVKKLLGNNTFEGATRMYETPKDVASASHLPPRQRREAKSIKLQQTQNREKKRKSAVLYQQSHNSAYLERVKGSKELRCCAKRKESAKKTKLTFSEAAARVVKHAKSPSMICKPCTGGNIHSEVGVFVTVGEDMKNFFTLNSEGIVVSWSGPLQLYDMKGWSQHKGGFLRPRPQCPNQGMAIREPSTTFEWLPGMKDLVREKLVHHTASSAPCESIANAVSMDGRWSDLACPTKTHIKNFVMSYFTKKKKAAEHALERQGKRSYNSYSLMWLKKEVEHRGMVVGNRKTPGCIKLLEAHDDENEGNLTKYHSIEDSYAKATKRLGYAAFKKAIESRAKPANVPWLEWYLYQKECVYQNIEITSRLREVGLCKLLHQHYLTQDIIVKKHDETHTVEGKPAYEVGDKVNMYWKRKWYPATIIKCYPNHTWDIRYPPPADQVYWSRLPSGLLKKATKKAT